MFLVYFYLEKWENNNTLTPSSSGSFCSGYFGEAATDDLILKGENYE